jgi:GrpB-like predicted nucleotidyltransferase (UPF0157 family)
MPADDGLEPLPASLAGTWGNTETMAGRGSAGSKERTEMSEDFDKYFQVSVSVVVRGEDADEVARYLRDCISTEPDIVDVVVGIAREVAPAA